MLVLGTISRRERRLLSRLHSAGAIALDRAHPLPALGRAPEGWQKRLVDLGLLRLDPDGRGYVDEPAYTRALRAWRVVLTSCLLLAVAVLAWLVFR